MDNIILIFAFIAIILSFSYGWYITRKLKLERKDLEEVEEEYIKEFISKYEDLDKELADKIENIQSLNTVVFDCPCNHNTIAVPIDLSNPENTFVCPECKNEYKIEISMIPILKGKIVDKHNMYNLLAETYNKATEALEDSNSDEN